MDTDDPDLCYALTARKNARRLSRLYDNHLEPAGVTVSQFSILTLLSSKGPLKTAELADFLVMERTSLVRALKPLQSAGWIATHPAAEGRGHELALTAAGRKKTAAAVPLWRSAQRAFEAEVGRDRAIRQRDETLRLTPGR
jgi:DNA-binding MarR family transcriptional regulator